MASRKAHPSSMLFESDVHTELKKMFHFNVRSKFESSLKLLSLEQSKYVIVQLRYSGASSYEYGRMYVSISMCQDMIITVQYPYFPFFIMFLIFLKSFTIVIINLLKVSQWHNTTQNTMSYINASLKSLGETRLIVFKFVLRQISWLNKIPSKNPQHVQKHYLC